MECTSGSRISRPIVLVVLIAFLVPPLKAQKRIALSFDDVPRHSGAFFSPDERTNRLIAALDRAGVDQAGFFVTTGNLEKPDGLGGEKRIESYVAAGHVIGNHSTAHLWLSRTPVAEYLDDLDGAHRWLSGRAGYRPWFRYPYLDEGRGDLAKRNALRRGLAERGLHNAYITVDNYDWYLDAAASKAHRSGTPLDMESLGVLYVETLVQAADFYHQIAIDALGRPAAHVLLLHETDLNALFIEDLVQGLRAAAWEIIPLDEAYKDPIANSEPDTTFLGSGRVAALAHVAGWKPKDLVHERTDETVLGDLFAQRALLSPLESTPGGE